VAQLLDRLDDRFALLATPKRTGPSRQRSLAATVQWSYQLLDETEQRVFRAVSVFPAPFTLEAAEAIAGPDAGPAVLRLVDCSLLTPPRSGPDGRPRYSMLETLRSYGAARLAEAGEQDQAATALAGWALGVAGQAAAGLRTSSAEVAAARLLDAEDATLSQVLAWAMDHDPDAALRLAAWLAPWWLMRGRASGQYALLREAAGRAVPGGDAWCDAQFWLGQTALESGDKQVSLDHFTAIRDAIGDRGPSRALADALGSSATPLANLGRVDEAATQARRSLAMARELGYPAREAHALTELSLAASYAGDIDSAVALARQAGQITADIPGWIARVSRHFLTAWLIDAGDLPAAERTCAEALARCREAGDLRRLAMMLTIMATLDVRAGRMEDAAAHLREGLQILARTGGWAELDNILECCGYLCAATGRDAEAVTAWAASNALAPRELFAETVPWVRRLQEALRAARQVLGPGRARAAEERGTAMGRDTAAEYVLLLTSPVQQPAGAPGLGKLSARERELVTLVAQGSTDAQIAAQLSISVRTVRSRLDRIRDKTGCRRRADLTRLALQAGLV
jgi:DNA-binding CsgD family transcriptional regulator/tetratricopeptide (TPR) repeat protein